MRSPRPLWIVLGSTLLGIVAGGPRWMQACDSLWLDELHTAWCVLDGWSEIAPRAQIGNQPPLYFRLPWLVVALVGPGELALRLPSLVAGCLLAPVTAALLWRWTDSWEAGVWAGLLVAVDRNLIFYAQEARAYALLQLVAWCHVGVVWRLSGGSHPSLRAAFVAGAVLMFYLHYTAALFLAGEAVFLWFAASPRRARRPQGSGDQPDAPTAILAGGARPGYRRRQLALDLLVVAAASLPLAPHVAAIAAHREAWSAVVPRPSWQGLVLLLRWEAYLWIPLAAAIVEVVRRIAGSRRSRGHPDRGVPGAMRCWVLLAALLAVPAALAWLTSELQIASLFLRRYLASCLLAPVALTTCSAWTLPHRWQRHLACLFALALSIATSGMVAQYLRDGRLLADRDQDWRSAVAIINGSSDRPENRVTFVRSGFLEAERLRQPHSPLLESYCLAPVRSLYPLEGTVVPLPNSVAGGLDDIPASLSHPSRDRWWIVNGSGATRSAFESELRRRLSQERVRQTLSHRHQFGTLLVLGVPATSSSSQPTSANSITSP